MTPLNRPMRRDIEVVPDHLADLLLPLPPGVRPIEGGGGYGEIALISIALIGAAVGAYGQYASSQQQSANLEYNAILAQQQAVYQQRVGEFQAELLARQAAGSLTLAEAEAALQDQQAIAAQAAGEVREAGMRRAYDRTQSDVRAAIGKSGVDTTGSPLMVLLENADTIGQELALNEYQTALDVAGAKAGAAYARTQGSLRAGSLTGEASFARFGGSSAAAASLAQANMFGMQAGAARSAGAFRVGTTLLNGAGDAAGAYGSYLRYGRTGGGFPGYGYGTA